MKYLSFIFAAAILISGCSTNKINEDETVKAELYMIHSKLKSYETFSVDSRRDWPKSYAFEDVLKDLPKGSEPTIIYKGELQSNWNKFSAKEEFNSITWTPYDVKVFDKIEGKKPNITEFKIDITPKYYPDGRTVLSMKYVVQLLEDARYDEKNKEYYPVYEFFKEAKILSIERNKFYVASTMSLKNKESIIFVYRITN